MPPGWSRGAVRPHIKLLEEFGPRYFELSQLTRVSPETYRAIAPVIENGVLRFNCEEIPLNAENSRKVAAAVAEMRSSIPKSLRNGETWSDGSTLFARKPRCSNASRNWMSAAKLWSPSMKGCA
jgi:hypothetical protein